MSDWDGIRLCRVCGDRETTSDSGVCHVCRQQRLIDNDDDYVESYGAYLKWQQEQLDKWIKGDDAQRTDGATNERH